MKITSLLSFVLAALLIIISGCGVVTDMAKDKEFQWKFIGNPTFVSPLKLKVAVLPFEDQVGLGAPQAGANLARLLADELAKDDRLALLPPEEVAAYMAQRGWPGPPSNEEAAQIARELGANAVVIGSVSQLNAYNQRKNWRRYFRFMTSSQEYVMAMINIKAVDAATGIVLAARANVGDYKTGPANRDLVMENEISQGVPQQESIENSLDLAIEEAARRTVQGLANLPFKAAIQAVDGDEAAIRFGREVGLKKGQIMRVLAVEDTITNVIGQTYQIYGPAQAELKVIEVGPGQARLKLLEGRAAAGDLLQLAR